MAPWYRHNLAQRVFGALLLLPPVIAALWYSGVWYDSLLLLGGVMMIREWCNLIGERGRLVKGGMTGAIIMPLVIAQEMDVWRAEDAILPVLLVLVISIIMGKVAKMKSFMWLGIGFAYCLAPLLALEWLRDQPLNNAGFAIVLWCFFVVWGNDIGGYFVGKNVGGPKLAPRISPNKTWSGFIGGIFLASALGLAVWMAYQEIGTVIMVGLMGALMGFVGQIGDLFESGIKRHFGVKDSGSIIPGHGGILDRIDGLIFVVVLTALIMSITGIEAAL